MSAGIEWCVSGCTAKCVIHSVCAQQSVRSTQQVHSKVYCPSSSAQQSVPSIQCVHNKVCHPSSRCTAKCVVHSVCAQQSVPSIQQVHSKVCHPSSGCTAKCAVHPAGAQKSVLSIQQVHNKVCHLSSGYTAKCAVHLQNQSHHEVILHSLRFAKILWLANSQLSLSRDLFLLAIFPQPWHSGKW